VQALLGWLGVGFGHLLAALPLGASRALGRAAAWVAYWTIPRVRRVGMANLDLAYGDGLSRAEKRRILRAATRNVGIVMAELFQIPRIFPHRAEALVTIEGAENIDSSRGCLAIGAHFGNWEWLAPVWAHHGQKTAEVVRPLDNPRLNAFVDKVRRASGIVTVPKHHAAAEVKRLLEQGYLVGILADQNVRDRAVPVTFFGRRTWATIGPVLLARRTGVPVHTLSIHRQPDGTYIERFSPEIPMVHTGDRLRDLVENTQRLQDAIESVVREQPDQWLWLHRRWRPRERLDREWAERLARQVSEK